MPDSVLGTGDIAGEKIGKNSFHQNVYISTGKKKTINIINSIDIMPKVVNFMRKLKAG